MFTFAGFDAPKLREIIQSQLPPPPPSTELPPAPANPTYENYIGLLFAARCTDCHGATPSAGLNFSTYAGAIKGSENGAVILAGNSANSRIVIVQSGDHFALFSPEELAAIIAWIEAGAPEK